VTGSELPLHVEVLGPEPGPDVDTFLLIHGYGASTFTWRHWAPKLASRGHVVLMDMKGFGQAPKPKDGRYGPEDQAELAHRLIEERGLGDLTLVGHSIGGGVALLTALRLLDAGSTRLKRMVIVAGAAYQQRLPPFVRLAEHPRLSTLIMRAIGPRMIVRAVLRSIVHDPTKVDTLQVRGYADPLRSGLAIRALIESARQIRPPNLDELASRYAELEVPTLLMWGRHDRVVPLSVGERLAVALPNARLQVLEACGHLPAEELPTQSLTILESFLDGGLSAL